MKKKWFICFCRIQKRQHHYIIIKDLNKFFQAKNLRRFLCGSCLTSYTTEACLNVHTELCNKVDPIKVIYPEDNTIVFFPPLRSKGYNQFLVHATLSRVWYL